MYYIMAVNLVTPILYSILISLISLIGIILLKISDKKIFYLVSFAAGSFLGAVFINIFPRLCTSPTTYYIVLFSIILFAIIEELMHWHHHTEEKHTVGYLNLLGDFIHNFIDGLALAAAFKISYSLGLSMFLVILFHEIPQELGDFSVLLYSGLSKIKALIFNFLVSLTALFGVIIGWYVNINPIYLMALVAGNFIYISVADLIPLLRRELSKNQKIKAFITFIFGILLIYALKQISI